MLKRKRPRRRKAAGVFLFLTKRNLSYIAGYDIILLVEIKENKKGKKMDYLEAIDETSYLSVPNAMERTAAVRGSCAG